MPRRLLHIAFLLWLVAFIGWCASLAGLSELQNKVDDDGCSAWSDSAPLTTTTRWSQHDQQLLIGPCGPHGPEQMLPTPKSQVKRCRHERLALWEA